MHRRPLLVRGQRRGSGARELGLQPLARERFERSGLKIVKVYVHLLKKGALRPREAPERERLEQNNDHSVDVAPAVPPGPILRLVGDPRRAADPIFSLL